MKIKIGKVFLWTAVMCSFTASLFAQGDGGQAGAFLRYGVGGRAMGMGSAFCAVADDASGVYWNPAGLMGVKRIELSSMYSNLYYDSQFSHFGLVLPRPGTNVKNKLLKFLIGPSSSIGIGWVSLTMTGFEQRTNTGSLLGDFGVGENAFLIAWAKELVGFWGIFQYGLNFKLVNQDFSGLQASPSSNIGDNHDCWSSGADIGFTFQPIHAPIFRIVSLQYLLPLRMGFVVQNLLQPAWNITGNHKDPFPRVIRWGLSYRWILKDWIPSSWKTLRNIFGNSQIQTTFDKEFLSGCKSGTYFGAEGQFAITDKGFAFNPRIGYNSRSKGVTLGMGLSLPFTRSALIRIDYVYGYHSFLPQDNKFFLTLQMGKNKGARYFRENSQNEDIEERQVRTYLYRILAEYPNEFIEDAVNELVDLDDSTLTKRYYDLIGGIGRAEWLFQEAKNSLRNKQVIKAQKKATSAISEYSPGFNQPENVLSDNELLNYGESLIILDRVEEAVTVLEEVGEASLRLYYLLGVCKKEIGEWDGAIDMFSEAIKQYEGEKDYQSMISLSFMGLIESQLQKGQFQSALTTISIVLRDYQQKLDNDYPRYPIYHDDYIADDAQFLQGVCHVLLDHTEEGVVSLMKTQRFFPESEYGQYIDQKSDILIRAISTGNWARVENLTNQFLAHYLQNHQWPNNR